ncbi:hypothetical protein [Streptomyces dangxiongensis]|uniref:hypothetical protein n=1 Tax=Streptomyces dangxiongensis TaxID=1442032 RepID=UPI001969CA68|nr:hypothetical protein [Streptomyces dangxiongensis]
MEQRTDAEQEDRQGRGQHQAPSPVARRPAGRRAPACGVRAWAGDVTGISPFARPD